MTSLHIDEGTRKKLASVLAALEKPPSEHWPSGTFTNESRIRISDSVPRAYLLKFILVDLLKFPCEYMPMEKILWEIPFGFEGLNCIVSSEKFGYSIYVNSKAEARVSAAMGSLVRKLNQAIGIVDDALKVFADERILSGDLVVQSHYLRLKGMYEYFRDAANEKRKLTHKSTRPITEQLRKINSVLQKRKEAFYFEQAAYFVFFGLLEHLLVLLLAFKDFDPTKENLRDFIFESWANKYKRIFTLTDTEAHGHYDKLLTISRAHRNLHAHGMFSKEDHSFWFHLEGTGLLSANFSESELDPMPWFSANDEGLNAIGEFLRWLSLHPSYKVPMQIIEGGLNVDFSSSGRSQYKELVESGDAMEYVQHTAEMIDRHQNMDW